MHPLPHMPYRNSARCWCGGRLCIYRERWRQDARRLIGPLLLLLLFATAAGSLASLALSAVGWPPGLRALSGVVVAGFVVAGAWALD